VTTPISEFIFHRLEIAIINRHTKFEVSTIKCNEHTKLSKIVKILVLSQPLIDGLRGNANRVHLWLVSMESALSTSY